MIKYDEIMGDSRCREILTELLAEHSGRFRKVLALLYAGVELEYDGMIICMDKDTNLYQKAERTRGEEKDYVCLPMNDMITQTLTGLTNKYKENHELMIKASYILAMI